jgi:hypothetical protein
MSYLRSKTLFSFLFLINYRSYINAFLQILVAILMWILLSIFLKQFYGFLFRFGLTHISAN